MGERHQRVLQQAASALYTQGNEHGGVPHGGYCVHGGLGEQPAQENSGYRTPEELFEAELDRIYAL